MPAKPIERSEWQAEIERIMVKAGDDGLTTKELQNLLGVSNRTCLIRLQELNSAGRLIAGRRQKQAIDGTMRTVAVYRIKRGKP